MELLIKLLAAGLVMGVLDFLWLGTIARRFYHSELGGILKQRPSMVPALLFYLIYVVGVVVFVIDPALDKNSLAYAIGYGALFGFVAYATYDLTNLSTLKGFSSRVVVVDLLWGAFITASMAGAGYWAGKSLLVL